MQLIIYLKINSIASGKHRPPHPTEELRDRHPYQEKPPPAYQGIEGSASMPPEPTSTATADEESNEELADEEPNHEPEPGEEEQPDDQISAKRLKRYSKGHNNCERQFFFRDKISFLND